MSKVQAQQLSNIIKDTTERNLSAREMDLIANTESLRALANMILAERK